VIGGYFEFFFSLVLPSADLPNLVRQSLFNNNEIFILFSFCLLWFGANFFTSVLQVQYTVNVLTIFTDAMTGTKNPVERSEKESHERDVLKALFEAAQFNLYFLRVMT
jgi:hypothetical protein